MPIVSFKVHGNFFLQGQPLVQFGHLLGFLFMLNSIKGMNNYKQVTWTISSTCYFVKSLSFFQRVSRSLCHRAGRMQGEGVIMLPPPRDMGHSVFSHCGGASSIHWVEAKDVAEHPTMHIMVKNPTQGVNSTKPEKPVILFINQYNCVDVCSVPDTVLGSPDHVGAGSSSLPRSPHLHNPFLQGPQNQPTHTLIPSHVRENQSIQTKEASGFSFVRWREKTQGHQECFLLKRR